MFSFSKLIYLRKRYKLSSAGNKFPSFLILLFVNAKNSLDNVNHPLSFVVVPFHSSPQVFDWVHIHFSLKCPYSFTSTLLRTAVRPWRPFTCSPKQMYMQFSPMTLLSSSTQPNLVLEAIHSHSVWKPPSAGLSALTCLLLQELWQIVFTSTCQLWLRDTSLIPRVNGVAGLGTPKSEWFLFLQDLFKASHLWSGLGDTMKMFLFDFELSSARYKSWPALSLWIFSQCSLTTTLTVAQSSWKLDFLNFMLILWTEGLLRYLDMLERAAFLLVRAWLWNVVLTQFTVSWPSKRRN